MTKIHFLILFSFIQGISGCYLRDSYSATARPVAIATNGNLETAKTGQLQLQVMRDVFLFDKILYAGSAPLLRFKDDVDPAFDDVRFCERPSLGGLSGPIVRLVPSGGIVRNIALVTESTVAYTGDFLVGDVMIEGTVRRVVLNDLCLPAVFQKRATFNLNRRFLDELPNDRERQRKAD